MLSIEDGVLFNGTLEMTEAIRDREVSRDTSYRSVDAPVVALKRAAA